MTAVGNKRDDRVVRVPRDAVLVAAGFGLLVLSALPVHRHRISGAETSVFHAINGHTVLPFVVVWPIMQLGNIGAVPVAAAAAAIARRWRLAIGMLAGGLVTYYLAKVVKKIVIRGRPAELVDDVRIRGAAALGRGYVSGHAAVVTLLVVLAWPYLGRRGRAIGVTVAIIVCLARVYVGAHLPLDIVGGAALGLAVAGAVRLVAGRPEPRTGQ
jgi:membrane-associated phospholipid phosphatase